MDHNNSIMDYNKIIPIRRIQPVVDVANYFTLRDRETSWGPRRIPDYELILIREGVFLYEEMEKTDASFPEKERKGEELRLLLHPGDLLVIPPETEHVFRETKGRGAISCIHCLPLPGIPPEAGRLTPLPACRTTPDSAEYALLDSLFHRCAELFQEYHPFREELLTTVCREIWLRLAAHWKDSDSDSAISGRMEKMLVFIRENCTGGIGRQEIAEEFNLVPEYVNALFRKELGISPTECINRERILRGYVLIHNEGRSVKEAAWMCGFRDPFYFSRLFRKVLGISPETLRGKEYFS